MEMHLDLTLSNLIPFSIIALGVNLRLENVSVSVENAGIGDVKGMIPYSGATSVRNGRFEITNTQGDGCGVAGKLRGPALLDSVYVGLEARGGAAVAFQAVAAQFKMIHCLFREALQQGGVVLGEMEDVAVEVWVDSRYETNMVENDEFGELTGVSIETKCKQRQGSIVYHAVKGQIDCVGSCQNMNVTLDMVLSSNQLCPFTNANQVQYVYIYGKATVTQTGASLVSYSVTTKLNCVIIAASVPSTTYTFSLALYKASGDVTFTNLVLNSTSATSANAGGVSAIQTLNYSLEMRGIVLEGVYSTGDMSGLLVKTTQSKDITLTLERVKANLSQCIFSANSAILIYYLQAICHMTDVTVNYTQSKNQNIDRFSCIVNQHEGTVFSASRITVNATFNSMQNGALLLHTTQNNIAMTGVCLRATQFGATNSTVSPFYKLSGKLANYEAVISFSTGTFASIATYAAQADVKNASIRAPATASQTANKAMLFQYAQNNPLTLWNITAIDFVQGPQVNASMLVGSSSTDIIATNLAFESVRFETNSGPAGLLVAYVSGESQLHSFTSLRISGRYANSASSNPYAGLFYGRVGVLSGNAIALKTQGCSVDISVIQENPGSVFGYVEHCSAFTIELQDTEVNTNAHAIQCALLGVGVAKPALIGGGFCVFL